jgi:hypothetical protein
MIYEHRIKNAHNEQLVVMGDFNADIQRRKRFDQLLNKLIKNCELIDGATLFEQALKY